MSESELDNNENPMIDSEVVESKIIMQDEDKPVANKKGSFMAFLAFVFSLAALVLSGYHYYLNQFKPTVDLTNTDIELLKSSIVALEKKSSQQFRQLNDLLAQSKQNNQELSSQLATLQDKVEQTPITLDTEQANESFDDSVLNQQVANLQNKLNQQNKLIELLQTDLNSSKTQYSQSLVKLTLDLQSQISQQSTVLPLVSDVDNGKSLAGSLLQESYVQLNINGNVVKAQELLDKTIDHLSELEGLRYSRLATELDSFSQQLKTIEQPEIEELKNEIKTLTKSTAQLSFFDAETVNEEGKNSSWYENLISIKKVDDNKQPKLSKSEQATIHNVIRSHYQMLNLALMSNNQSLWNSEIERIQSLLELHFADNAQEINKQLIALKNTDINPVLPNLEAYLKQFKAINIADENE